MRPIIAAILFVGLSLFSVTSPAADVRIGMIKAVSGDVVVLRGDERLPAEPGVRLFESDVIETGENSAIGMTFVDNSRISLGPDSTLSLETFRFDGGRDDSFEARLDRGTLTAASGEIARSRPLAMRILMPTTVLGVKGTEFAVRVSG